MSNSITILFPITSLFNSTSTLFNTQSWYPSPHRPIVPRPWFIPTIFLALTISLMFPRSVRLTIATPALLLLFSQTRAVSSGNIATDFSVAALVFGFVLKWIDYGMLVKDGELFRLDEASKNERGSGAGWRFKEAFELLTFNLRGIGWNWRVGGIPKQSPQTKIIYLLQTSLRLLSTLLLHDAIKTLTSTLLPAPLPPGTFYTLPFPRQILLTWLHQAQALTFFQTPYLLASLLCVSLSLSHPQAWPPLFGPLSDAYLVSRAWGRTWHQLLRRPLGLLTPYVQRLLGVDSRAGKRSVGLACAFFMSGLAHWVGCWNVPMKPGAGAGGMFWYFMLQAPVIRLEDYVVDFGRERGFRGNCFWKVLGWTWTFAWFSFSMRWAAAWQFESGPLSVEGEARYSVVRWVVGKMGS